MGLTQLTSSKLAVNRVVCSSCELDSWAAIYWASVADRLTDCNLEWPSRRKCGVTEL